MRFSDVIGQRRAIELLRRTLERDRVPHGLLFLGPERVGKATVALAYAAAMMCGRRGTDGACGTCSTCLRVAHRNHPDLFLIRRLPKKATDAVDPAAARDDEDLRSQIVVDQVREIVEHAGFAPREAPRRVFVIDSADRMNAEAQNALLKTLEEPPGRAVLILVSSRAHALLPTVRSRCLAVEFATVPGPELAAALVARGLPRTEAIERSALAGGRPGRALEMDPAALRARRKEILEDLLDLPRAPAALAELPRRAARLAGRDEATLLEGLELVQALLLDAARSEAGLPPEALLHGDLAVELEAFGRDLGKERAAGLAESVERLRSSLRFNANRTLIAEALLAAVAGGPLP